MTSPGQKRRPRVFSLDDPAVIPAAAQAEPGQMPGETSAGSTNDKMPADQTGLYRPTWHDAKRGFRWGAVLASAVVALSMLAIGAWFMRFVSAALQRQDWIGWTAYGLLGLAGLALFAIIIREAAGLMRLSRLRDFRKQVEAALAGGDLKAERKCAARLKSLYHDRADLAWALDRFKSHEGDIRDAGELLTLAERDLMGPLDEQARIVITKSAKRVSVVTALSPAALLDVLYVLAENLGLLRRLATLYGAKPGTLGGLRLARLVVAHIVATGGLALTDDLVGQFLGQDLLRRLSRRLGEGVFNGALTARIGIAAIAILRPLPFIEAKPVRLRELIPIIFRKQAAEKVS